MKKTRPHLKNRYLKGMYPTEDDFADWLDSFWHKDDEIDMQKVVQYIGGQRLTVTDLINAASQSSNIELLQQNVNNITLNLEWAEI